MNVGDVWAVSPAGAADAVYFRAVATHAAGALTLLQNNFVAAGALNGSGYRITLTSVGDLSGVTYTIVGMKVGDQTNTVTEAIAGGSTATVTTTNYWSSITSITASGTSGASTLSIGYAVNLALPRTRIRAWSYVGAASAGSLKVTMNSTTGTTILNLDTPASATFAGGLNFPMNGILVGRSAASTDFGIVVMTQITKATLFCG